MQPVSRRRHLGAGFSMVELMIGLSVLGIMLALGVPAMSGWIQAEKARGAAEFYAEGFKLARQQALAHNSASRLVLIANASNGQNDWRVDICFPTPTVVCDNLTGAWSSTASPAANDPEQTAGFLSVRRTAKSLPSSTILMPTTQPAGANTIYFNSNGWVNTNFAERLTGLQFAPGVGYDKSFRPSALMIGLAGTVTKCDPSVAVSDSRACPQ